MSVSFLSGTCGNRQEDCVNMGYCGNFSEVDLESSNLQEKRAVLVLSDPKSKEWEKIGKVSLKSHSQILEETRIQDPAQFYRQATKIFK